MAESVIQARRELRSLEEGVILGIRSASRRHDHGIIGKESFLLFCGHLGLDIDFLIIMILDFDNNASFLFGLLALDMDRVLLLIVTSINLDALLRFFGECGYFCLGILSSLGGTLALLGWGFKGR